MLLKPWKIYLKVKNQNQINLISANFKISKFGFSVVGESSGLAAPQIGVCQRIFLFYSNLVETENGYADSDNTKIRIFVNPKILKKSFEMSPGLEGCLSVPILSGVVFRPKVS